MELHSMLRGGLDGRGVWGEWTHVCVTAESLHCSPATTATLLTVCTPIQDKKCEVFLKKESFGSILK